MNIDDIKREVLNRIKEKYGTIPEEKIIKWINEVPKYEFEPLILDEDKEEIDKEDLFLRKVSEVILSIKEITFLKRDGLTMRTTFLCL